MPELEYIIEFVSEITRLSKEYGIILDVDEYGAICLALDDGTFRGYEFDGDTIHPVAIDKVNAA